MVDQADKENCPPPDDLAHLFEDDLPNPTDRPTTPTLTAFQPPDKLTTPTRPAPARSPTATDLFSSAAKALLHPHPPRTPSRTAPATDALALGEITPFTAHLNQLLSEANNLSPSHSHSISDPSHLTFDFSSLPSLHHDTGATITPTTTTHFPPASMETTTGFDFSHFDPQDLLSTDVPMPSSPPSLNATAVGAGGVAFFDLYEDPVSPDGYAAAGGLWGVEF